MKAVVCHAFGPPGALGFEDMPRPSPGPGEVLVEVHAAGVNFTDLLAVEGRSQLKRRFPFTPGCEAAGVVLECGEGVTRVRPGQRVLGTCVSGAYAEEVVFAEEELAVIPDTMDMRSAAVFFVASMTAYYALCSRARLAAGEILLVLGAGGGAGLAAVQIGKALGAKVVAAASSDEKLQLALADGADAGVRYDRGPLDLEAQKALAGALLRHARRGASDGPGIGDISTVRDTAGYHVIFDGIGGSYAEPALRTLGWEGRYLSVGFAAGMAKVALGPLLFKNADIMGIQPADPAARLPGLAPEMTARLFDWHTRGLLGPRITAELPLSEAAEALNTLSERRALGRIVLTTDRA